MLKFFTILLVAAVAAKAYDFSDSDYSEYSYNESKTTILTCLLLTDQMLFDEFEFLNEDVLFARQKRDAAVLPAEKKECASGRRAEYQKDFMCCTGDKFDPEHVKKAKDIKKQCAMKLRTNNCKQNQITEKFFEFAVEFSRKNNYSVNNNNKIPIQQF